MTKRKQTDKESKQRLAVLEEGEKQHKEVRGRINLVRTMMQKFCIEQDHLIDAMILAACGHQHCLSFGLPGCNKSGAIDLFTHLIGADIRNQMRSELVKDPQAYSEEEIHKATYTFKVTLDAYTAPEALLGPISIAAYKADKGYLRVLTDTIAEAEFANIEETFNGNGATLQALVRCLNEREIDNGGLRIKIPLRSAFGATNNEPRPNMAAVYDRFLVRVDVPYLDPSNGQAFERLMSQPRLNLRVINRVASVSDIDHVMEESQKVEISTTMIRDLKDFRAGLVSELHINLSPRRWANIGHLLRVSAWLNDRAEVKGPDVWNVCRFTCWDRRADIPELMKVLDVYRVEDAADKEVSEYNMAVSIYNDAIVQDPTTDEGARKLMRASGTINQIAGKLVNERHVAELQRMTDVLDCKINEA